MVLSATDLGREVTLPPTSLAWLVVPGAARKECGEERNTYRLL